MTYIICIEGIDNIGKTSVAKKLFDLFSEDRKTRYIHEPTGFADDRLCQIINTVFRETFDLGIINNFFSHSKNKDERKRILNKIRLELVNLARTCTFSRLKEEIKVSRNGIYFDHTNRQPIDILILDRGILSTLAYQGLNYINNNFYDDNFILSQVYRKCIEASFGIIPNITFLLHVPESMLKQLHKDDIIDTEELITIQNNYFKCARYLTQHQNWIIYNLENDKHQAYNDIIEILKKRFVVK